MAEFITTAVQTVQPNQDIIFTNVAVPSNNRSIIHREGSGLVSLRGITNQCRARFKVAFGGNIAVSEGGTVEPISVAIAIDGEPLMSSIMTVTPAAVGDFWNVSREIYIDVPCGCCSQVSVRNINTQAIDVSNVNFIAERVA